MSIKKINESSFNESQKQAVWEKGIIVKGHNPNEYRKDACGALILFDKYGDTTPHGGGWEIDHIKPISLGGTDDINNLQPLQWQNNRKKGDSYPIEPHEYCEVKAKS